MKNWCNKQISFYKSEFVVLILLILIIGCFGGYFWRYAQVEPIREKEIELLVKENALLEKHNRELLGRVVGLESTIKAKKKTNKQ